MAIEKKEANRIGIFIVTMATVRTVYVFVQCESSVVYYMFMQCFIVRNYYSKGMR